LPLDHDRIATTLAERGCITPALVIDLAQVERNIAAMLAFVGEARRWRPHVKTIKQARIVGLLLDAGVRHFKCATIPELRMVLDTATCCSPTPSAPRDCPRSPSSRARTRAALSG
jgi:D-serine deaminase-like pyridoxal phosphate-dependent protein